MKVEFENTKRGNKKPYFKEGQTTQWSKEKTKKTNNDILYTTQKTKDRATRTLLKT